MEKLGLIAGSDELPLVFADEARRDEKHIVAIAFRGYTSPGLDDKAQTHWLESVDVAEILGILKREKINSVAMQGKLPHSLLLSEKNMDAAAVEMLNKAGDFQTQSVLKRAAELLFSIGITVMDARRYLEPVLCPEGLISGREPSEKELADIKFGKEVLEKIGSADIGQLVVVKSRVVLAVEAIEGTDAAIERGAALGGEGVVIVKMTKPGQDLRFDLPVVGERTVKIMAGCGARVLAVESGKTVLLNRKRTVESADEAGVAIFGV